MSEGLWATPNKFLSFGETRLKSMGAEIASRSVAWDFSGMIGLLPDPDPILTKRGDGAEVLEELTADGHLLSVIQTRKLGTLKREHKWEPGTDGDESSPRAEQLCADLTADLKEVRIFDLISALLDAPYYGLIPVEILWKPANGTARIADLRPLPNRWFGFDEENNPRFRSINHVFDGEELPWGKFVFARHFPTYDNPYGLRLLSRCLWPVAFKKGGLKFWVTFMEKYGMPFLLGHYRQGATPDEQNAMLTSLAKMVQDSVAAVPEGNTVEMLVNKGTNSYQVYSRLIDAMDAEISKVIMGQTLTAEVGDKGSYAASKTHENVLDDYRQADQTLVKGVMDTIAGIYRDVNAPGVPAPMFTWFETEDPQQDFAERDKALTEGGRVRLTKSYYMRRYRFQEDDIEMVEQTESKLEDSGSPTPGTTQFAEAGKFTPEQQSLEELADLTIAGVDLAGNEERILQAVLDAASYEQAVENLLALYPELDMPGLRQLTERALVAAELFGRTKEEGPA